MSLVHNIFNSLDIHKVAAVLAHVKSKYVPALSGFPLYPDRGLTLI